MSVQFFEEYPFLFFFLMMLVPYFNAPKYEFKMKRDLENVTEKLGAQDREYKLSLENHKQGLKAPYLFTGFFSKPHIQVQRLYIPISSSVFCSCVTTLKEL